MIFQKLRIVGVSLAALAVVLPGRVGSAPARTSSESPSRVRITGRTDAMHIRERMLMEIQDAGLRTNRSAEDSIIAELIARMPADPTGYYARAASREVRAQGCEEARGERDDRALRADLDTAVRLAEARLRSRPDDVWSRFMLGLALGYRALLVGRSGEYVDAWRMAGRSVDELEEVLRRDPRFADAFLPLGAYHYWVGAATARWDWLPFVEDTRAKGVAELRRAARDGRVMRTSARSMLLWALLAEKRHGEALALADSLVATYPRHRSFLWARAEVLRGMERWIDAEQAYAAAARTFDRADESCPGYAMLRARRGLVLAAAGRCADARPLLDATVRFEPAGRGAGGWKRVRDEARDALARCGTGERTGR